MNMITPDRLAELTVRALERTAFMMADPVPVEPSALAAAGRCAAIRYSGPGSGIVTLRTTDDFLQALVANLLGVEADEAQIESYAQDALSELTNILGGSVISELGGRECVYSLGLPQLSEPAPADASTQICCLESEGQLLFVAWRPEAVSSSLAA